MTFLQPARLVRACLFAIGLPVAGSCSDATVIVADYRRPGSNQGGAAKSGGADASARVGDAGAGGSLAGAGGSVAAREASIGIASAARDSFCTEQGPALQSFASDGAGKLSPVCSAGIGRRLFSFAVCTCGNIELTGVVVDINSFDSRQGPFKTGERGGAALGSNGALHVDSLGTISGSVVIAGSEFRAAGGGFDGDVKSNASIDISVGVGFSRDLWVNGDIRGGPAPVRDIYQSPDHTGADALSRSGMLYVQPVTVNAPCPCDETSLLDIPGIVAFAQTHNDNAALGVSPAALASMLSAGSSPTGFSCGRFALAGLETSRDVFSEITGRTALFVEGDLSVGADLGAALPAGAELDVFVTGALRFSGPGSLGTPKRPSALRLYIGGSEALTITAANPIAAQLYAPHTPLTVDSTTAAFYGSIFAAQLETRSLFAMHYDRAIIDAGEACTSAEPTPARLLRAGSCQPCPNGLAAIDGVCGACTRDTDCCEPLVCADGACQPLILPTMPSQ